MPVTKKEVIETQVLDLPKQSILDERPQKIEVNITQEKEKKYSSTGLQKHLGYYFTNKGKDKVLFCSRRKHLQIYMNDNLMLGFQNHLFETDNSKAIEFLRNNPMFPNDICEGTMPKDWKKGTEDDEKWKSKNKDDVEPSYSMNMNK
jgi:hypothetical protein